MSSQTEHRKRADSYHHGELRPTLIRAACDHISLHGAESLSLRELAREAGVSANAPYKHFPNKAELLAAIAIHGYDLLEEYLVGAIDEVANGSVEARLEACCRSYVHFATSHPEKFNLMFGDAVTDLSQHTALHDRAEQVFVHFSDIVGQAEQEGLVDAGDMPELTAFIWAGMHGIACLIIKKMHDFGSEKPGAALQLVQYMNSHLDILIRRLVRGALIENAQPVN